MIDLGISLALLAIAAVAVIAYRARVRRAGSARNARVDAAGGSPLLGKGVMEGAYWLLEPMGRSAVHHGLSANAITWASLVAAALGAGAIAADHFGVGGALIIVAALGDALDGIVARQSGTGSDAGEVLDAAVDRYGELLLFAALAYRFRSAPIALGTTLAALIGSTMVSYGTAKAEALHVPAPRGAMRRGERAVYLSAGVVLTPITAAIAARSALPSWVATAPITIAVAIVAAVANVSAVRRLVAIAAAIRYIGASRSATRESLDRS